MLNYAYSNHKGVFMLRKNKARKRKDYLVILPLILIIIAVLGFHSFNNRPIAETSAARKSVVQEEAVKQEKVTTETVNLSDIVDTKNLQLVNSDYAFDSAEVGQSLASSSNGLLLRADVLSAVSGLLNDTRNTVGGELVLNSGYRSADEQSQLYLNTADKSYVQKPGHSEHETALAADIAIQNVANVENSPQSKYLIENAWKYGFILRYPGDKTQVTGIANEPWHFRYVGKIHAQYMSEHHLVLEEYINMLKKSGGYNFNKDGQSYTVRYEIPTNNQLQLPHDEEYEISSDNTGGYVITSWKAME